ncbi:hypothetical protein C6495_14670 [Candidatus Poribacteria bacterium]|nr:MAG: hypothetical protein C6495_14670 [Candidatus Poribacteria bacterium]
MKTAPTLANMKPYLLVLMLLLLTTPVYAAQSPIWTLQFSPDGKTIAVGKYQWIEVWDIETQRLIHTYEPHASAVRCLTFSRDGKTLFAGGGLAAQSGELRIWDVASEELLNTLEIHADTIESIAISPDETKLLTASMDEYSAILNIAQEAEVGNETTTWLSQHVGRVLCALYHPDGTYFATGSEDKTIKVWHPENHTVLINFDGNDEAVYSLAYAAGDELIVSGSADNTIRSWRVTVGGTSGPEAYTGALVREYNGHQGPVYSVDCGMWNNQEIIASGSADTSVIIWNLRSGNRRRTFDESTDAVYAVQLSPNGRLVAAGGRDGVVRIWHIGNSQLIHEFKEE